jgi:hypothetical protein
MLKASDICCLLNSDLFSSPLSWVMEGAAVVSIALSNGENRPPDWQVGSSLMYIVIHSLHLRVSSLLSINLAVGFRGYHGASPDCKSILSLWAQAKRVLHPPPPVLRTPVLVTTRRDLPETPSKL